MKISIVIGLIALLAGSAPSLAQGTSQSLAPGQTGSLPANTKREAMIIVGSTTLAHQTGLIADRLVSVRGIARPELALSGTARGIARFCAGVGPEYPDIVAASRRMNRRELQRCIENGAVDVVELRLGYSPLVLAVERGDPVFGLTARHLYLALAAEVPQGGDFVPNPFKTWKQIDPRLPDLDILVYGPATDSGTRGFFDDMVMQAGCRGLAEVKFIYSADERVRQCTTLREDGRYVAIAEPFAETVMQRVITGPYGAIAVVPHQMSEDYEAALELLPFNGVLPTQAAIHADEYDLVQPVLFYVKRAHMRDDRGEGVVRGLREFIAEAMSEEAIGPNGYMEQAGIVIMPARDRERARRSAFRLERFER